MNLRRGDEGLLSLPKHMGGLRSQTHQFFNTGPGFGNRKLLQQTSQLHDKGHLTRGKILADGHGSDQCQGHQHIGFDVKGGHQSNDGLQDDGNSAEHNGHPGQIKRQGPYTAQTEHHCDSRDHQQGDILFDAAQLQ